MKWTNSRLPACRSAPLCGNTTHIYTLEVSIERCVGQLEIETTSAAHALADEVVLVQLVHDFPHLACLEVHGAAHFVVLVVHRACVYVRVWEKEEVAGEQAAASVSMHMLVLH